MSEHAGVCTATDYDAGAGNQFGHIGGCPVHGPTVLEADRALRAEQFGSSATPAFPTEGAGHG